MTLRVGSLCSGVGMLDLAVESVLPGAQLAWYAQYEPPDKDGKPDRNQYAAQIMAHRFPGVPNHGDITAIDYAAVEPVDLLTAGWPCQDMSLAGKRAGLMPGTRSGLWIHVARAIEALRPSLVLLENVRSLTSARAHCDLEFCPGCMGAAGGGHRHCSTPASTRLCSRRPGRPRVRCGVAGARRLGCRGAAPAGAVLRPRVARRWLLPRFPVGVC